jgi:hypothetical protein
MDDAVYPDCPRNDQGVPTRPHQHHREQRGRCVYCGVLPEKAHRPDCPQSCQVGGTSLPHEWYEFLIMMGSVNKIDTGDIEKTAKACAAAFRAGYKCQITRYPGATSAQKSRSKELVESRIRELKGDSV